MQDSVSSDIILWPQKVSFGEVVYPPGGTLGPRQQSNLQLVLLHSGQVTIWIDGVARYAPANTVAVLFPDHQERFEFSKESPTHHTWLHTYLPNFSAQHLELFAGLPWPLPLSPLMLELIHRALAMQFDKIPRSALILQALAMEMLWLYIGEGELLLHKNQIATTNNTFHPSVARAQHFIWKNLEQPLTLEILAQAAGVSPSQLIRLFRAHVGTTPLSFVWQERVKKGLELLAQTGLTVGDIAQRCGFASSYHFSRRVRHFTSLSPLQVRRQHWRS